MYSFESKDLPNAFPHFAKPVIEIRTTSDVPVLEPPISFAPRLNLLPLTTIGGAILKRISNVLVQGSVEQQGHCLITLRVGLDAL